MGIPQEFDNTISDLHLYQSILIIEVALTLLGYLGFKVTHYAKFGYEEEQQKQEGTQNVLQPEAEQEEKAKKWDQETWNKQFPTLFAFHIGAVSVAILYIYHKAAIVLGFLHLVFLLLLAVFNNCVMNEAARKIGSYLFWILMCLVNMSLLGVGLAGVFEVYT